MFEQISDFFNKQPVSQNMRTTTPSSISSLYTPPPAPIVKKVNPKKIPEAIRYLESSGGIDPNTPKNIQRSYTIPAMNQNEKARVIKYNTGFGGEYGLTPVALAELAKSKIDREAPPEKFTKFGRPLIPGRAPEEIQKLLLTPEGAGQLANEYFMMKREKKDSFAPEDLANDYIDYYVGKGMINDTPKNRKRALDYFNSLID